ncbi:MAG TPA: transposase [Gammaproteobacteria bacterium]|nr:transposase [Gammaproteobacteria bacterium]
MHSKPHGRNLRKGRFSQPNQIYLITMVVQNRHPALANLTAGRSLVQALKIVQPKAETLSYVAMPDHFHWLLQLGEKATLSGVVRDFKSASSRLVNRGRSETGSLWQKGYHDHALRSDEDMQAVARYMTANPLRAGLVKHIGDYPWWDAVWL